MKTLLLLIMIIMKMILIVPAKGRGAPVLEPFGELLADLGAAHQLVGPRRLVLVRPQLVLPGERHRHRCHGHEHGGDDDDDDDDDEEEEEEDEGDRHDDGDQEVYFPVVFAIS
jgi:hypothetical protein